MQTKPKRPPSVWISQIILVIYIAVTALPVMIGILGVLASNMPTRDVISFIIGAAILLSLSVLFAVAFWGLAKRKVWGRWLTVVILSCGLLLSFVSQFFPAQGMRPTNSAQMTGYFFGGFIVFVPFAFLIWRLATGDAAADFFSEQEPEAEIVVPPPPTFDS